MPQMFTNQKILGLILILFIIGAAIYFTVSKFKQEVINISPSPSPSPQNLDFILTRSPAPQPTTAQTQQPSKQQTVQAQPQELPLAKNKQLAQFPGILTDESLQNKKALIQTGKGTIQIEIFPETKIASSNFIILAANGFYDGLTFHRVEDWVVQGGDPLGNGTGGPGYVFPDEPVTREYKKGIVAYANRGPNTNGSQFFILLADKTDLPKQYTIFGIVISGMEVVEKITPGDIMQRVIIQHLNPVKPAP